MFVGATAVSGIVVLLPGALLYRHYFRVETRDIDRVLAALKTRAFEHKDTIRIGRKARELGGTYDGWETSVER